MNNIDILEEKEKKAINNLNFIIVTDIYNNEVSIDKTKIINEYNESVGIVLNLVKTLIAENKELKEEKEKLGKLYYEASENCIKYENRIKKAIDYIGIDDDILETCGMFDVNGIELLKILKGWLDE